MTRDEIVTEAARRLGDTSTSFLAEIDKAFDFVLQDLAANECISALRKVNATQLVVLDQLDYDTLLLTGSTTPDYPIELISLRVWAWSPFSLLIKTNDRLFEANRSLDGEAIRGRPRMWRTYPNEATVQLWPRADGDNAGETLEALYVAPPTAISGATQLTEIRREHIEVIVNGLQSRNALFLDETITDPSIAWQLYLAGRDRMFARRHNSGIGTVLPAE